MQGKPKKKRGRGRPKKQKIEKPKFETNAEIRQFLMDVNLDIIMEMKDQALKRGNIKKPEIARAKNSQYKVLLSAIKTFDTILKNKQIDEIESKLNSLTLGFTPGNEDAPKIDLEKLHDNIKELKEVQ